MGSPIDRADGRTVGQLRPMKINLSALNRADGTAVYTQGKTQVMCAVYGPTNVKAKSEKIDRTSIQVSYKGKITSFVNTKLVNSSGAAAMEIDGDQDLTGARAANAAADIAVESAEVESGYVGYSDRNTNEFTQILEGCLNHCVLTHLYPRTAINVTAQVMDDDGASLSASINACVLALMDAGVGMSTTVAAVEVGIDADGRVFLDPTLDEVKNELVATATFALDMSRKGKGTRDVVAEFTTGRLTVESYAACLAAARAACRAITGFYKKAMQNKYEKSNYLHDQSKQ